jgi:hypothetical protein
MIFDAARNTSNPRTYYLSPSTSGTENSNSAIDFLSNGFKIRAADNTNRSGDTIIYAAFAESPFGGSNVAPATAR